MSQSQHTTTYASSATAPRISEPKPFGAGDFPTAARIKWDDAMGWARSNKIVLPSNPKEALMAVNLARERWGLPLFSIIDLAEKFTVIRRPQTGQ